MGEVKLTTEQVQKIKAIDIANLRFYSDMAKQFQWGTDIIHWGVIAQTLSEIADRYESPPGRAMAHIIEPLASDWLAMREAAKEDHA